MKGFIVPGCELVTCVLKNNVSVIAAVIENALTEFEIKLRENNAVSENFDSEFRNILLKVLDFDKLDSYQKIFNSKLSIEHFFISN